MSLRHDASPSPPEPDAAPEQPQRRVTVVSVRRSRTWLRRLALLLLAPAVVVLVLPAGVALYHWAAGWFPESATARQPAMNRPEVIEPWKQENQRLRDHAARALAMSRELEDRIHALEVDPPIRVVVDTEMVDRLTARLQESQASLLQARAEIDRLGQIAGQSVERLRAAESRARAAETRAVRAENEARDAVRQAQTQRTTPNDSALVAAKNTEIASLRRRIAELEHRVATARAGATDSRRPPTDPAEAFRRAGREVERTIDATVRRLQQTVGKLEGDKRAYRAALSDRDHEISALRGKIADLLRRRSR